MKLSSGIEKLQNKALRKPSIVWANAIKKVSVLRKMKLKLRNGFLRRETKVFNYNNKIV